MILVQRKRRSKLRGEKMKWSWRVGKIAGIDLKIHLTFVFILIWYGLSTYLGGGSLTAALSNVLLILALFFSVVLHEFGHALTARLFGISTRDITLLPIGGIARLESMPEDPKEELLVSIAGPAVNAVIAGGLFTGLLLSGFFNPPLVMAEMLSNFWLQLMVANITLVLFNLVPAFPMDGGRVLRSVMAMFMDHLKATRIASNIGRGLAVLMGIAGFFVNPWLILTAAFVWFGAGAEAQATELKVGLKGLVVRDAMVSQFYQVEANQSLSDVFQLAMSTGQSDIPVVSNGNFLGIIRRADLMKAIDRLGNRAPAYAAIGAEPPGLAPEMPLEEVLPKFATHRALPVLDGRQLIGLVTSESIQQRMWLNQRMNAANKPRTTGESTDVA
jgi:Zn-dependent protease/predicted transcriptional regulator